VLSKNDPYCGADFDHCRNPETGEISTWAAAHIAVLRAAGAYIEISVSGTGVHAITRATIGRGIKKTLGEVYDRGRYFTMSGCALDPTPIGDGQAAIDALRAELRGMKGDKAAKPPRDGAAGNGDRAALAAAHEADFEEGRRLQRTSRDLILKRFLLATEREETQQGRPNQGHYAARTLWAELHQRCPQIGLYRADGSLDDSQACAAMARAIYGGGFSFAEYTVIMSYHFAGYCLAKWGTKQAWREELAALWYDAIANTPYTPKAPTPKRAVVKKPVGRASNHASQVERVYQLLQEHRVGDKATIKTADLAAESGAPYHAVS